jgi:5-methyltetrahydropteroyltriglutamate--homocysteine methyltransferase
MLHFRGGRAAISSEAYPDLEAFYDDVAACYRAELKQLGEAGCTYVQLDDTNLAYLCDPNMREGARKRGDDPNELPRRYARLINAAIADRPAGMTVCTHLCRGNFKSAWVAEGGYEPVAEVLFNDLAVNGYFLEYDDARSGDFSPLRFVPRGKFVVLGLVTTKVGQLESKDELKRRIDPLRSARPVMPVAPVRILEHCARKRDRARIAGGEAAVDRGDRAGGVGSGLKAANAVASLIRHQYTRKYRVVD